MDLDDIRADFDEIAGFGEPGATGADRYDPFLLSLVPPDATQSLDVGCGHGRLTRSLAARSRDCRHRSVAGDDRARRASKPRGRQDRAPRLHRLSEPRRRFKKSWTV